MEEGDVGLAAELPEARIYLRPAVAISISREKSLGPVTDGVEDVRFSSSRNGVIPVGVRETGFKLFSASSSRITCRHALRRRLKQKSRITKKTRIKPPIPPPTIAATGAAVECDSPLAGALGM